MPRSHGAFYWLGIVSVCGCLILTVYNFLLVPWLTAASHDGYSFSIYDSILGDGPSPTAIASSYSSIGNPCTWHPGDPVIYNLKTKLGVNYDAGHWFHMAENFMVQHSFLRERGLLTNASIVIYNFDAAGFTKQLNGVTRLLVYLGTKQPLTSTDSLYFTHLSHPWTKPSQSMKGVTLPWHAFDEVQKVNLRMKMVHTAERFVRISDYNTWPSSIVNKKNSNASRTLRGGYEEDIDFSGSEVSLSTVNHATYDRRALASTGKLCAKFMEEIGGNWPTMQRGHWFPNPGDIESFRDKIRSACPADGAVMKQYKKKRKYKLVIYQRDLSRKLANEKEAIHMIEEKLSSTEQRDGAMKERNVAVEWSIEVLMHDSKRSPCLLSHILHDADVLVTPHGFQSMLLLFLPRPALLFEIFPYRYYKRGYGPFGHEYGIVHGGVMSPPMKWHTAIILKYISTNTCMGSKFCRNYARNQDVVLTAHGTTRLLEFIKKHIALLSPGNTPRATKTNSWVSSSEGMSIALPYNMERDYLY